MNNLDRPVASGEVKSVTSTHEKKKLTPMKILDIDDFPAKFYQTFKE